MAHLLRRKNSPENGGEKQIVSGEKNRFSAFHSFLALKRFRFTFQPLEFRFAFTVKTDALCEKPSRPLPIFALGESRLYRIRSLLLQSSPHQLFVFLTIGFSNRSPPPQVVTGDASVFRKKNTPCSETEQGVKSSRGQELKLRGRRTEARQATRPSHRSGTGAHTSHRSTGARAPGRRNYQLVRKRCRRSRS